MKKLALFVSVLGLICFAYNGLSYADENCPNGTTIGISRNPGSCYQCHQPHIMVYHNENILSHTVPLNMNCNICHSHITTVTDVSCDGCHTKHSFGSLGMNCQVGTWAMTGPMAIARFYNSASLLENGGFMVAGGSTPPAFGATKTVEILDPITRMFTTAAPLSVTRVSHMQTTLKDGKVLITGGRAQLFGAPGAQAYNTAEIYDPATNTFMPTGLMNAKRRSHRDILLDDGRVLVTGGTSALAGDITSVSLNSAEIYDPATGTFTPVGNMNQARQSHHLVKLLDGKVLVVGGGAGPGLANPLSSMEIFDPATNSFTPAASMTNPRMTCAVSLLADGKVLLAFSWNGQVVTPQSELYDPATDTILPITGKLPFHGKVDNLAVRLYDNTVVIPTGGNANIQVLPDTSVYVPDQNGFIMAGSVQFPRTTGYGTGALLTDGRIVTAGGIGLTAAGSPKFFRNGEIYTASDISQVQGLKNLIDALPAGAFDAPGHQDALMAQIDTIEKDILKNNKNNYKNALKKLDDIISRFDSCAMGASSGDWIVACDDQAKPYAVAVRLKKTIQEITGVLKPPVITVAASPVAGGQPLTVNFTATATDPDGTVLSYYWDFGNGANSVLQNASNTYTCPGKYTATCSVIDNDGLISEATIDINVAYPTGVTAQYKCDLAPAYNAFCAKVCHYSGASYAVGQGVDLSSYAGIMAGRKNPDGTFAHAIVIPGDPANSPIEIITGPPRIHAHDVGGERLNDDVKEKQRAWILEGAQNN